ncbi:MAG TPA: hypothetical protein PLY73_02125, partial [Candidatus Ozemobacteraceae bacterium]|nr:hypothetical protein [Candidatus Ozemobacteraceae bacterium]
GIARGVDERKIQLSAGVCQSRGQMTGDEDAPVLRMFAPCPYFGEGADSVDGRPALREKDVPDIVSFETNQETAMAITRLGGRFLDRAFHACRALEGRERLFDEVSHFKRRPGASHARHPCVHFLSLFTKREHIINMNKVAGFGNRKKSYFAQLAELAHNLHMNCTDGATAQNAKSRISKEYQGVSPGRNCTGIAPDLHATCTLFSFRVKCGKLRNLHELAWNMTRPCL